MRQQDRGSASLEVAITFPVLLAIGLLLFAAMQTMTAHSQVQAAARAGARAAATGASRTDAEARADAAANAALATGSTCQGTANINTIGFGPGQATTVTVKCEVDTVFDVLGSRWAYGEATEYVSELRGGLD